MYKVEITQQAAQELERIMDYIATKLDSPIAALEFATEIMQHYERLENAPYLYEACRDAKLRALGYRRVVIKNYILIYRVDEATARVYILHFFHGTQAYQNLI